MYSENGRINPIKIIAHGVIGVTLLIIALGSFGTVDAGSRGVVTRWNAVTGEVKEEGLYFKWPLMDDVIEMDVKTQKEEATASAASRDLQDVTTQIAVNYHLDPKHIATTYQTLRKEAATKIIQPALQDVIKASTAKFTAEELVTRRSDVRDEMERAFREKLSGNNVVVLESFNVVNLEFSQAFSQAIERKVTAVQDAEASKNRLEQIKYEAQQAIERAKGEAESIRIQSQALSAQPQFLEKIAIERWDGKLPVYMGGDAPVPFINIGQ